MKKLWLLPILLFSLILSGCATSRMSSTVTPGANLRSLKTFYVQRLPSDERGIEKLIAAELTNMGYQASYGDAPLPEGEVDAVVTYEDRWMWDITMYMLELKVKILDPDTQFPLAEGYTFRTSLVRKPPEEMVKEVMNDIFNSKE